MFLKSFLKYEGGIYKMSSNVDTLKSRKEIDEKRFKTFEADMTALIEFFATK